MIHWINGIFEVKIQGEHTLIIINRFIQTICVSHQCLMRQQFDAIAVRSTSGYFLIKECSNIFANKSCLLKSSIDCAQSTRTRKQIETGLLMINDRFILHVRQSQQINEGPRHLFQYDILNGYTIPSSPTLPWNWYPIKKNRSATVRKSSETVVRSSKIAV